MVIFIIWIVIESNVDLILIDKTHIKIKGIIKVLLFFSSLLLTVVIVFKKRETHERSSYILVRALNFFLCWARFHYCERTY